MTLRIWCGIDWSERHHDVALVDNDGVLIAKRRIPESAAGFRQLLELLAEHRERSGAPIPRGGFLLKRKAVSLRCRRERSTSCLHAGHGRRRQLSIAPAVTGSSDRRWASWFEPPAGSSLT